MIVVLVYLQGMCNTVSVDWFACVVETRFWLIFLGRQKVGKRGAVCGHPGWQWIIWWFVEGLKTG